MENKLRNSGHFTGESNLHLQFTPAYRHPARNAQRNQEENHRTGLNQRVLQEKPASSRRNRLPSHARI